MESNEKKVSGIDRESGRRVKGWLAHQVNIFSEPEPCIIDKKGRLFFIKPETLRFEGEENEQ